MTVVQRNDARGALQCRTEASDSKTDAAGIFRKTLLDENVPTHSIVPLAVLSDWLVQVLLAPVAEALDGLGDATQRAVDLVRVHVLGVILHHATGHTDTEINTDWVYIKCIPEENTQACICVAGMQNALASALFTHNRLVIWSILSI